MMSDKNWLEQTLFVAGCVLTAGTFVLLGYQAWWMPEAQPPQLAVKLDAPEHVPEGVAVPVTVVNRGGQTAENVEVEITARADGRQVASGTVTFAFVPTGAQRKGRVVFAVAISPESAFAVQSVGYQLP